MQLTLDGTEDLRDHARVPDHGLRIKPGRGAGDADGGKNLAAAVEDGHRHAADAEFMLHVVNGVALQADRFELTPQRHRVGDRAIGEGRHGPCELRLALRLLDKVEVPK